MNLHQIAAGAIGAINPFIPVTVQQSSGYTVGLDGHRTPTYATIQSTAQIQALAGHEIQRLNYLGIQGLMCKAFLNGDWQGLDRSDNKGGDYFTFVGASGGTETWKVVQVLETWPDWSSVALCRQVGPIPGL